MTRDSTGLADASLNAALVLLANALGDLCCLSDPRFLGAGGRLYSDITY